MIKKSNKISKYSLRLLVLFWATVLFFGHVKGQLHFGSLGSWGTGSSTQSAVASALKKQAVKQKMSFIVSPGSNFIGGITDMNDSRWQTDFENIYRGPELFMPFYTILGAEDWKKNYTSMALKSQQFYTNSTLQGEKIPIFTFPNWWYHFVIHFTDSTETSAAYGSTEGSVGFIFIDTIVLSDSFPFKNITRMHWDAIKVNVEAAAKIFDWVVVVGDKAILSSGASKGDTFLASTLRPFLKENKVDVYISGNDYDFEIIEDGPLLHINCGTGSGADSISRVKTDSSVVYIAKPGFCHHMVTEKYFKTEFINGYSGEVMTNYTKSRNVRERSTLDRFHIYKKQPKVEYVPIPELLSLASTAKERDMFLQVVGTTGVCLGFSSLLFIAVILAHRTIKKLQ